MGTVVLDSSILIGFLSPTDAHHEAAVAAIVPLLASTHALLIPASVYAEILVHAIRENQSERIDGLIQDARMEVVDIDRAIARRAASLRAERRRLRLPDALALATTLQYGATFLTADDHLQRIAEGLV